MKNLCYLLTFAIVFNFFGAQVVAGQTATDKSIAKAKEKVQRIGGDGKTTMQIKTFDGKVYKGKISKITADGFDISEKNGITTTITFASVKSAGRPGLSNGGKAAIIGGVAAAALIPLIFFFRYYCNEQSC